MLTTRHRARQLVATLAIPTTIETSTPMTFKPGDTVIHVEPSHGRGPAIVTTRKIGKVGRKYVYLDDRNQFGDDVPFDKETGEERIPNGYSNYRQRIYHPGRLGSEATPLGRAQRDQGTRHQLQRNRRPEAHNRDARKAGRRATRRRQLRTTRRPGARNRAEYEVTQHFSVKGFRNGTLCGRH